MMFSVPGIINQTTSNQVGYKDAVLADTPLIFLTFENNQLVINDSFAYQSGLPIIYTTPTFGESIVEGLNQSLNSSITANFIRLATGTSILPTSTFRNGSLELWLKSTIVPQFRFAIRDETGIFFNGSTVTPYLLRRAGTNVSVSFLANTIYHIVYTFSATNNLVQLYVNNVQILSQTLTPSTGSNSGNINFTGGRGTDGDGFPRIMQGLSQALAVYDFPLNQTQIGTHYNAGRIIV